MGFVEEPTHVIDVPEPLEIPDPAAPAEEPEEVPAWPQTNRKVRRCEI